MVFFFFFCQTSKQSKLGIPCNADSGFGFEGSVPCSGFKVTQNTAWWKGVGCMNFNMLEAIHFLRVVGPGGGWIAFYDLRRLLVE